ncbi:MAG: hypothetical protein ACI4JE_08685 [Ruminococcus sp.]
MKRTICIILAFIMLISVTACGNKTVTETNDTHSFSETQNTETQRTDEELNETSSVNTEDTVPYTAANESTASASDESSNMHSSAASECYPYNNGMDSPEEVIEAYLDANINFDSEALYALFNLDEAAVSCAYLKSCLKAEGATDTFASTYISSYSLQAGIYYTMMMDALDDNELIIRVNNPTKMYSYKGEGADSLDYYESFFEEVEAENPDLNSPSIEKVYLYDSVGVEDADGNFYEFIEDDIPVLCIDGKYYLPIDTILGGMDDSGYWQYADVILDAYEKEKLDFEANAYPANAGMDSPEEVANAYIEALKSDTPEAVYALFNTSECKWMTEAFDKMCIEAYGVNSPIRMTKTACMINIIQDGMSERCKQAESIILNEETDHGSYYEECEEIVETYGVPMPFTTHEWQCYSIQADDFSWYRDFWVYSVDGKWYLSVFTFM